jgi:hypothetical protein
MVFVTFRIVLQISLITSQLEGSFLSHISVTRSTNNSRRFLDVSLRLEPRPSPFLHSTLLIAHRSGSRTLSLPTTSTMNDKSKLPSKLLDLPNELWHHIMSSDRKPRFGDDSHFKSGYVNRARYRSLRNTSLAHRILQPFAQEELLSVLEILANESLDMLLTTLEGSDRLASYAKRTEKINLIVDDEKIEDGVLSRLARLCPNVHEIHSTNVSIDLSGISELPHHLALCLTSTHFHCTFQLASRSYAASTQIGASCMLRIRSNRFRT